MQAICLVIFVLGSGPFVAPMSTRGDGQSRMFETCLTPGACAFTGKPAGHARMPPGRRDL